MTREATSTADCHRASSSAAVVPALVALVRSTLQVIGRHLSHRAAAAGVAAPLRNENCVDFAAPSPVSVEVGVGDRPVPAGSGRMLAVITGAADEVVGAASVGEAGGLVEAGGQVEAGGLVDVDGLVDGAGSRGGETTTGLRSCR